MEDENEEAMVSAALVIGCTTLHDEWPMQLDVRELIKMQVAPKIQAQGEHDM